MIVERPTYDRTLLSLRQRGAHVHAVELEPDGIDTDALARLLAAAARSRRSPTSSPTSRTRPATRSRWPSARRCWRSPPSTASSCSRTTPTSSCASAASRCRRCSRWTPSASSTPRRSPRPSARASASATWSGRAELIDAIAQLATNTYISPNMVAQSIVYEFCASGAIERSIETVKTALARARATLADALRRELPEAEFVAPAGRLLHVGHAARRAPTSTRCSTPPPSAAWRSSRAPTSCSRAARTRCAWPTRASRPSRSTRASRASPSLPLAVAAASRVALAAVALAEHELLGQRGARRRRGVGDHRDGLGDARRDRAASPVGGLRRRPAPSSRSASVPSRPGSRPERLQVVQQVLGLVLEAQHAHRGADLDVGQRHARRGARRRRSGGRAGRSWRRRSRRACAPRAPATSRARGARPPRAPRPRARRARRSGSARSGGGGARCPRRARRRSSVKAIARSLPRVM